jgi:hypothetical protein
MDPSCRKDPTRVTIDARARSLSEGAGGHTARRVSVKGVGSFAHLYLPLSLFFVLVFLCTLFPRGCSIGSLFPLLYRTIEPAPQDRFHIHETQPSENATVSLFRP